MSYIFHILEKKISRKQNITVAFYREIHARGRGDWNFLSSFLLLSLPSVPFFSLISFSSIPFSFLFSSSSYFYSFYSSPLLFFLFFLLFLSSSSFYVLYIMLIVLLSLMDPLILLLWSIVSHFSSFHPCWFCPTAHLEVLWITHIFTVLIFVDFYQIPGCHLAK